MDRSGRVCRASATTRKLAASLASDEVRAVLEDQRATCGSGHRRAWICSIAPPDDFLTIATTTATPDSLRDSYIMSLYQDTAGLVWIGTREGGVSRWNPRSWELGGRRPDWLAGKLVTAFADAPGGKVWIASMGGGLVRFDDATRRDVDIDAHRRAPQRHRRSARDVAALGSRWHAVDRHHGERSQEADSQRTARIDSRQARRSAQPQRRGHHDDLRGAHDGQIWIGTHGGGANVLDPATGLIRQLPYVRPQAR